ncbi:hypothetical protein ACP70R_025536 [Stipagrostis hirtigluma subsp. patula]
MSCSGPSSEELPSRWPTLQEDLFFVACSLVSPRDIINMKLTCKDWRDKAPRVYHAVSPLWVSLTSGRVLFGCPVHQLLFSIREQFNIPEAHYSSSNDSLVTLVEKSGQIWVAQIVGGLIRMLPKQMDHAMGIQQAISWIVHEDSFGTFTIGGDGQNVCISMHGHPMGWMRWTYECSTPFYLSETSAPVIKDGCVFCIGVNCEMGVFDLDERTWTILFPMTLYWPSSAQQNNYLMVSGEDFFACIVSTHFTGEESPVTVLKLNFEKQRWERIRSLEGRVIFTGGSTSALMQTGAPSLQDRIFLPHVDELRRVTECVIRKQDEDVFFMVDKVHQGSVEPVNFTCWIHGDENTRSSKPGGPPRTLRPPCTISEYELPAGTWIQLRAFPADDEEAAVCFIGPAPRPEESKASVDI